MQLVTFLSAASAMVATASARSAVQLNAGCDTSKPLARVVNRCDYPVYLWSVYKGDGCPEGEMVTLKKGEMYKENLADPKDGVTGISIKISKTKQCKGNDITQLEYFRELKKEGFKFNYLDVSYVDCLDGDCPTRKEGYHLVSGSQSGAYAASAGNTWCPVLSCHDPVSCAKMSYVLPDDVQTKTCDNDQNMDFYMCGGDAPTQDYDSAPVVAKPSPTPSSVKDTYSAGKFKADAAAVTAAPEVKEPVKQQKTKTHVEVVYVTAYEYVNAKRHAHGHARRHQQFHA